MIKYNNFEQTKLAIQRYVEAGDYSRPHIIATDMDRTVVRQNAGVHGTIQRELLCGAS